MTSTQSKQLRVYVVWLPALFTDGFQDAREASGEFSDSRVRYFWDKDKALGDAFGEALKLDRFAWDVYLLFDRGRKWDQGPHPDFWMHQLGIAQEIAPSLDAVALSKEVAKLLAIGYQ